MFYLNVEIADEESEWHEGLSERRELAPDRAMLFVYSRPEQLSFWMRDTFVPLDLSFLDDDYVIREQYPLHPESEESVVSNGEYRLALETLRGVLAENGIGIGDCVKPYFRRNVMTNRQIAASLLRLAKSLVAQDFDRYMVRLFSHEDGKFWSEGQSIYKEERFALKWAQDAVRDGYDAVVWSGDYLIAYGGPNMNENIAKKHGTGTVNQLTKTVQRVKRISKALIAETKVVAIFPGENPKHPYMFYYEAEDGRIWYTTNHSQRGSVVARNMAEFVKMVKGGKLRAWLVRDGKVFYKPKETPREVEQTPLDEDGKQYLEDESAGEFEQFVSIVEDDGIDEANDWLKRALQHWKRTLDAEEYTYFVAHLTTTILDWKRKNKYV